LPACFAARPVAPAAERSPPAALPAALFAPPSASAACLPCLVPAAFEPAVEDFARCWLRFLVAAAFFAAADLSALVRCAMAPPSFG
jgi:hypothetical protein